MYNNVAPHFVIGPQLRVQFIPKDMLKDLDQVAAETGRNRSEVITTSLEFALKHMEIVKEENSED